MNENTIENEINRYRATLDTIKKIYPFLPNPHELPVTIPAIFRKLYDENFISDYLAHVLHPQKNGIGIKPLLTFLKLVGVEIEIDAQTVVTVSREYSLSEYGRIDLLILIGETYAIGIENKILQTERDEQTPNYFQALEQRFKEYHQRYYIYLTPDGSKPRSQEFKSISYQQLFQALKAIQYDWSKDVRKSIIWEDFLIHLEYYIVMGKGKPNISEKTKLYIENYQILDGLKKAFEYDAKNIFMYIVTQIEHEITEDNWIFNFKDSRYYQQIYKKEWGQENIFVHYKFWFDINFLTQTKFQYMIDVEGKEKNRFINFFKEKVYPSLQIEYEQKGIICCPPNRGIAIVWKEYEIEKDIDKVEKPFILAVRESSFLTSAIDKALEELN